ASRAAAADRRSPVLALARDVRREACAARRADRAASARHVRRVQLRDRGDAPAGRRRLRVAGALVPLLPALGARSVGDDDVVAGGRRDRGRAAADLPLPDGLPLRAVALARRYRLVHHVLAVAGLRVLRAGAATLGAHGGGGPPDRG